MSNNDPTSNKVELNTSRETDTNLVPGFDVERVPALTTNPGLDTGTYESLISRLINVLGEKNVLYDNDSRSFYAEDTFRSFETPLAAISPDSIAVLSEAVKICYEGNIALVPRGGGMSYTDGYLHTRKESITVDMQKMDKILEINEEDMWNLR